MTNFIFLDVQKISKMWFPAGSFLPLLNLSVNSFPLSVRILVILNGKNHHRSTTIQKSVAGDIYYTRVTGIPEEFAKTIYDLLNIAVKKKRKIKKQIVHL